LRLRERTLDRVESLALCPLGDYAPGAPDSPQSGGYLAGMRRALGGRVMERRLTHLPGNLRLLVLALVVLSVATMLTLALALAVGGDYTGPNFAIVRTALSVVIIAGAGLGVATVGAISGFDDPDTVTNRRHRLGRLGDGLLTVAALTILFALVHCLSPESCSSCSAWSADWA
jgi:hypothetical protein